MIAEATVSESFAGWSAAAPPPTHREFAGRLKLPGGPLVGTPYDPATDPVQNYFVEQLDSGEWESLTWTAPPQIAGKTQCAILLPVLRGAVGMRCDVGYGLPTLHDLDRGWQTKMAPTFRKAGMGDYLPKDGPGSKGGRPPSLYLEDPDNNRARLGGIVFIAGGAKQVTVRIVALDELDAWRDSEGNPHWTDIEDAWSRADSFQGDAVRIGTGTVECDDPARSIILPLVNQRGTGTRAHHKCPHCGAYSPAEFARLSYEYGTTGSGNDAGPDLKRAAQSARLACPACGSVLDENARRTGLLAARFAHKGQMVDATGSIIGPRPSTRHFGLRTHALDCILTTLGAIAEKEATARFALENHGNHELMRKYWRYQRVECYAGDVDAEGKTAAPLDHRALAARSQATAWTQVVDDRDESRRWSRNWCLDLPPADFAVPAFDVQRNRLYTSATGFAADRQTWDLCWSIESARAGTRDDEPPPFAPGELAATLTRAADWHEERLGDLFRVGVVDTGDTAADCIDELIDWLATRPRWLGVRGTGRKGSASVTGDPGLPKVSEGRDRTDYDREIDGLICWERRWKPGIGRYIVATTAASRAYLTAYRATPGKPGSANLPGPLKPGNAYLRHLTARGDVAHKSTGVVTFRDLGGRHDWGDCKAYSYAVGMAILETGRDRASRKPDPKPSVSPPRQQDNGGWMDGFGASL